MVLEALESRDHLAELNRGLELMFGDRFKSFEIKQDYPSARVNVPSATSDRYTITVHLNVTVQSMLYDRKWSFDHDIANCSSKISSYQDYRLGSIIVRIEYFTTDFEAFLDALTKQTWNKYQEQFTENLETILTVDKT